MAQQLRNINLVAPAFKGINTEDSPMAQDPSFAEIADNAVIDKRGRIATRKGYNVLTTDKTALGTSYIRGLKEYKGATSNTVFSVGNNRILSGTATLVNETPAGYTVSADNWKIVTFNDNIYFFQDNQEPLVYSDEFEVIVVDSTTGFVVDETITGGTSSATATIKSVHSSTELYIEKTRSGSFSAAETITGGTSSTTATFSSKEDGSLLKMSDLTGASAVGDIPKGNEVIGAYGRLWTADLNTNTSTVYWSDLLIGHNWTGGTSGSIDISKVWPDGYDEIVSLAAHNGLLIIFGKHSIVVYQGAEAPATMSLADTVAGVGCVDRDTVQYTGTDVIFLSHSGLRSFGRTVREKSMPISTLSNTITRDIIELLQNEGQYYRSVYSPEENFYLLTFVEENTTYCFNLKGTLEDGSFRVTRWPSSTFTAYTRLEDGSLYVANDNGIGQYTGYQDNGEAYTFRYYSPSLTFGDSSKIKIIKRIRPTIVGSNQNTAFVKYGYDFTQVYKSVEFEIGSQTPAYFNVNEFGANSNPLSEFTVGELIVQKTLNATGNGSTVVIGLEAEVNGFAFSLQQIDVQALLGKTI
jgi:hypothetical protein